MVGHKTSQWQKKPPLTHFLCLPILTAASQPQLERSLKQFKHEMCSDAPGGQDVSKATQTASTTDPLPRIHPTAIRPLGALHLTLGVMSLNQDQLAKASTLLQSLDISALLSPHSEPDSVSQSALEQGGRVSPISIDLKGLESMHALESTSILYAAPSDPTERLYSFCLALQDRFKDFLVPDDRPLRLHATIVNTVYAKSRKSASRGSASDDRSQGHGPNAKGSLKFDARTILEHYKDHVWAENFQLDRIAICEMGAKKILDAAKVHVVEERYTEVACAALPG